MGRPTANRRTESSFDRPATSEPHFQDVLMDSEFVCPCSDTHELPVEGEQFCSIGVSHLLLSRRPAAVARLVVPVVVDPVDLMFLRRTWPHVGKEVLERVHPTVANRDATATVAAPSFVIRVFASTFKASPDGIFAPLLAVTGEAVAKVRVVGRLLSSHTRSLLAGRVRTAARGTTRSAVRILAKGW